jgi:hypothetical protein
METKILLAAVFFFVGWLWSYLFLRQLLFNVLTAYPLIRKMHATREDLIAVGAMRYTGVSVVTCLIVSAIILFAVIRFCKLYNIISFAVGAVAALLMLLNKLTPKNRPMFDAFCSAYCRFVPDDELRTAMYNKKPGQIKSRLREMGLDSSFVPQFKDE